MKLTPACSPILSTRFQQDRRSDFGVFTFKKEIGAGIQTLTSLASLDGQAWNFPLPMSAKKAVLKA